MSNRRDESIRIVAFASRLPEEEGRDEPSAGLAYLGERMCDRRFPRSSSTVEPHNQSIRVDYSAYPVDDLLDDCIARVRMAFWRVKSLSFCCKYIAQWISSRQNFIMSYYRGVYIPTIRVARIFVSYLRLDR